MLKSVTAAIVSVAIGAIFGPVAVAAGSAFYAMRYTEIDAQYEATRLVDAYRNHLPSGLLFLSIALPEDGSECGYDPDAIFPGDRIESIFGAPESYVDYEGYLALDRWRALHPDEIWLAAIRKKVAGDMSTFDLMFLRQCIEGTVFSETCMKKVAVYGTNVGKEKSVIDSYDYAAGDENELVCTFVDGIAARRGIPLAVRKSNAE